MSEDKPKYPIYPREKMGDEFAKWLLAAYKEIPGGGLASAVFGTFWRPVIERKREEFFDDLAKDIWILKDKYEQFQPENLKQNEEFLNMTLEVVDRVMRTSQKEKIKRLRNFLLNGAIERKTGESDKKKLLNIVDKIDEDHLFLLDYFKDKKYVIRDKDNSLHAGAPVAETKDIIIDESYKTKQKFPDINIEDIALTTAGNYNSILAPYLTDIKKNYKHSNTGINPTIPAGRIFKELRQEELIVIIKLKITEKSYSNLNPDQSVFVVMITNTAIELLKFIKDPTST